MKKKVKQDYPKISIVIPCYNEEKTVGNIIDKIENLNLPNFEIIIVNDASSDNTLKILKSYENVRVLSHKSNCGYGKSITDGIRNSTGEIIVTIDSDGQHEPLDLPILIKPILNNEADVVIGSRYKGIYLYKLPLLNRTGEAFIEVMLKLLFGKGVKSNQGGYRVFHRKTKHIFENVKYSGMAFTTEILMISLLNGYRIVEEPIRLHDRKIGKSRVKKIKLLFDILSGFCYYFIISLKTKYGKNKGKKYP